MQRWQPNELSNNGFSFEKSADVVGPMNLFDVEEIALHFPCM